MKALTPQEIMINDLVLYDPNVFTEDEYEPTHPLEYLRIENEEQIDCAIEHCYYAIPLSEELLEKIGFHFGYTSNENDFCSSTGCSLPEKGWCYDEGDGEIKILFPNESDGGLIRLDDQSYDRHLEIVFVKQFYLHELQHLMKICKVDLEIKL